MEVVIIFFIFSAGEKGHGIECGRCHGRERCARSEETVLGEEVEAVCGLVCIAALTAAAAGGEARETRE